jgi:hypothetical protein
MKLMNKINEAHKTEGREMRENNIKRFVATWGSSYVAPGSQEVALDFFSEELCYDDEDRAKIAALAVGESCDLDVGDHSVKRVS